MPRSEGSDAKSAQTRFPTISTCPLLVVRLHPKAERAKEQVQEDRKCALEGSDSEKQLAKKQWLEKVALSLSSKAATIYVCQSRSKEKEDHSGGLRFQRTI